MKTVETINEAMDFFLSNSDGSVVCKKGDVEKECDCFPDAKAFFESTAE